MSINSIFNIYPVRVNENYSLTQRNQSLISILTIIKITPGVWILILSSHLNFEFDFEFEFQVRISMLSFNVIFELGFEFPV